MRQKIKKGAVRLLVGVAVGDNGAIDVNYYINPNKSEVLGLETFDTYSTWDLEGSQVVEISIFEALVKRPEKPIHKNVRLKKVKTVKVDPTDEP